MGLINALAGGVSAAAGAAADYYGKSALQDDMAKIELDKAQRIMEMKKQYEDTERTEKADRVGKATTGLINQTLDKKINSYADGPTISLANSDVVSRETSAERSRLEADPLTRARAAQSTGDMSDKDYIALALGERRADEKSKNDLANLGIQKEQLEATKEHYRAIAGNQAATLNLKKDEIKAVDSAVDKYSTARTAYDSLPENVDAATKKAAKSAVDTQAIALARYGIKIGAEGEGSFHANVVKDALDGDSVVVTNQKTGATRYERPPKGGAAPTISAGGVKLDQLFPPKK